MRDGVKKLESDNIVKKSEKKEGKIIVEDP